MSEQEEKRQLLAAVNDLIADPDPRIKREALEVCFAARKRGLPLILGDYALMLNPLLTVMADEERWEHIKNLIDTKRMRSGHTPLWPKVVASFDKNEYQNELMRMRRHLAGLAVEAENLRRPARAQLRGPERLMFERVKLKEWGQERDALLALAREKSGGKLTAKEAADVRAQFYASLEARLEREIEDAKRQSQG